MSEMTIKEAATLLPDGHALAIMQGTKVVRVWISRTKWPAHIHAPEYIIGSQREEGSMTMPLECCVQEFEAELCRIGKEEK